MRPLLLILAGVLAVSPVFAGRTFNGTTAHLNYGNLMSTFTGTTYSVAAWGRPLNDTRVLFSFRHSAGPTSVLFQLDLNAGSARYIVRNGSSISAISSKASAYSSGSWTHFAGVRDGDNTLVYVNGAAGTPASGALGTLVDVTCETVMMGAYTNSGVPALFWEGDAAEFAIWMFALTAEDTAALAAGYSPMLIRPSTLVFYVPLWRDIFDYRRGLTATDVSTTASPNHPRLYR
jgi:hypothetical protein